MWELCLLVYVVSRFLEQSFWEALGSRKVQDSEGLILRQEISPAFQLIFNLVQVVIGPDQFPRSVIELSKLVEFIRRVPKLEWFEVLKHSDLCCL